MNKLQELYLLIIQWATDRNLILGASPVGQTLKLTSEIGELADAILKNDKAGRIDGIGDAFVVLSILAAQFGIDLKGWLDRPFFRVKVGNEQARFLELLTNTGSFSYAVETANGRNLHIDGSVNLTRAIESLIRLSDSLGLVFEDCVAYSYNEIKDRTGVMHNGAFIKSTDAMYPQAVAEVLAAAKTSTEV